MYFPIGWPKAVNLSLPGESCDVKHICFDAVKILVAAVGANFLGIWYANPLIPIVYYKRSVESVGKYGESKFVIWKPDSRQMLVLTCSGIFILYQVDFEATGNGIFQQVDPPMFSLKRDSAELFIKENIPKLSLMEVCHIQLNSRVTTVCCTSLTELLIATKNSELIRVQWSELVLGNFRDLDPTSTIDLRQVDFYVNQQCNLKNVPPIRPDSYVASLEYSPFIGGCAAVFSDKRAAFLIANHLRFEAESMHGFWIPEVEDATVCSVNHKFRLLAYGRYNSDVSVYAIEDTTGGLEFSHRLSLNAIVMHGTLGAVNEMKWSPDGCVLVVAWKNGGIALWSTFGALLMSSFSWDFGVHIDLLQDNPLCVNKLEWSTEGYQLLLTCEPQKCESTMNEIHSNVLQLNFVKSALTMNPCMTSHPHILIQGDDTLYLNQGDNIEKIYFGNKIVFPNNKSEEHPETEDVNQIGDDCVEIKNEVAVSTILSENKYWTVVQLPQTYAATNWPIRYSAIDDEGLHIAVAGRTGLAHYSIITKKWKLFGNESQEKDFVVSGGLLWWKGFIVCGCYSLLDRTDQVRCYPEESKLDNQYGNRIQVRAPVISLNMFRDQLIALTADGIVTLFAMRKCNAFILQANCVYEVDVKSICIHPACIVSLTVTNLRNDLTAKVLVSTGNSDAAETIIVNVCGRILMIQKDNSNIVVNSLMASCLASCVECFWLSNTSQESSPMKDCLWLFSGVHGMRVWLPILPPSNEPKREGSHRLHTFMSKRIMLSFPLKLYPLVILFDNVIVLGVENETTLYSSETNSHFSLPFSQLARKSQVYLHMILRQLIKRNLGYSAWEIAQSCCHLPYFPHSLELLLHEVLEEEATSKEPIPDALLPSILDFIREFPVYLQTIVQCARKTEIALWPYLFSMAGKPKDLFQQCLESQELVAAASYLIILQNLEPSFISRQYATLLLEIALQYRNWELAKDLIRFLKAIDPNEIDSPRSSMVVNVKIAPPSQAQSQVNQNPDAFNLVLGPIARERSFSTTGLASTATKEKKDKISTANVGANNESSTLNSANVTQAVIRRKSERSNPAKNDKRENFCIETILYRHARKLLQNCKLIDLGYMSAFLDFHLVSWLSQEADKSGRLENYVAAINLLHEELKLPTPVTFFSLSEESDQDYNQMQKRFQLDRDMKCLRTSSQTSESGYFSLSLMDTATSVQNGNTTNYANIPSIKENEELQYSSLMQTTQHLVQLNSDCNKSRSNSQTSLDHNTLYRRFYPLNDEMSSSLTLASNYTEIHHKILPEKMAIKMRYLLQLFIEANCIDFALVLSILLQDAASIGRIINVLIRSETVAACSRVQTSLKQVAQWSFDSECIYRSFMISLQPHIFLLDQFIQSSSVSLTVAQPTVGAVNNVQCILNQTRNSDSSDQKDSIKCGEHQTNPLNNSHGIHSAVGNSMKIGNWSYDKYRAEDKCNILSRQLSTESASHSCPSSREKSVENARSFSYNHQDVNRNETSGCIVM